MTKDTNIRVREPQNPVEGEYTLDNYGTLGQTSAGNRPVHTESTGNNTVNNYSTGSILSNNMEQFVYEKIKSS